MSTSLKYVINKYFVISLQLLLWVFLSVPVYSADMKPGFLESLDLAPDVFVESDSVKNQKSSIKKPVVTPKNSDLNKPNSKQGRLAANSRKTDYKISQSNLSSNALELPEMWHYVLLTLIALVFIVILMVLLRIYRNTREVESAENIVHQIKSLSHDIEEQNRSVRDVKLRIQKTENSFLKVLAHHIDDKNEQLLKDIDMQFHDFAALHKSSSQQYTSIGSRIGEIENLLGTLKEFVAEQKQEIRRMQDGYDWSVVNGLCLGIIDVVDRIDEEISATSNKKEIGRLVDIRGLLLIMLETHHVAELKPDDKKDYSALESDENMEIVFCDTEKDEEHGKVAKILQSSFIYEGSKGDNRVIQKLKFIGKGLMGHTRKGNGVRP